MKPSICPHCGSQAYSDVGIVIEDLVEGRVSVHGVSMRLPRREALALQTLLKAAPRWVSREAMHSGMYGELEDGGPDSNAVQSHLSKLRSRLKPHGIMISNARHQGYGLKRA